LHTSLKVVCRLYILTSCIGYNIMRIIYPHRLKILCKSLVIIKEPNSRFVTRLFAKYGIVLTKYLVYFNIYTSENWGSEISYIDTMKVSFSRQSKNT